MSRIKELFSAPDAAYRCGAFRIVTGLLRSVHLSSLQQTDVFQVLQIVANLCRSTPDSMGQSFSSVCEPRTLRDKDMKAPSRFRHFPQSSIHAVVDGFCIEASVS